MLEVKFKSDMTEGIEEIADHVIVDTASFKIVDIQPEELREGKFTDINEASWL